MNNLNIETSKFWRLSGVLLASLLLISITCFGKGRDIYQIKIYSIESAQQEQRMDAFLKDAYIPAMHRAGISKIGVFKPISGDDMEGKQISPDIKWMGFVTLIPGDREKGKMVKVESENLNVCHMCFISGEPEKFIKDKRLERENANYIVRREPFEKVEMEGKG